MLTRTVCSIALATLPIFHAVDCAASEIGDVHARRSKVEQRVPDLELAAAPQHVNSPDLQLRAKAIAMARERMRRDKGLYSPQELREIETLYQVANENWGTQEAQDSLKTLVQKYKKANRTGCAILYLGQMSVGDEAIAYLRRAIANHGDCFYGDGVQVGAFARFFLGKVYRANGNAEKAAMLFAEIRKDYPEAIDHNGRLLIEQLPPAGTEGR